MRILHIYNINQVAETYGEELTQRGHLVKVYEPSLKGSSTSFPKKLAMMPERILDLRHIVGDLYPNSFDLVHIHWASYGILGLVGHIPFVVHCHGEDVLHPTFRPILAPIFRRAAAVLCITPDLMPCVQSMRPDAIFFPGPIDTDHFAKADSINVASERPWTILLLARLVPKKGLEISTQGIARFAQRHPQVRVILIDWGTEKEKYKQLYGERFEFVPRVSPKLVPDLIQSADVVVGQFLSGALGLSELQGMSCAKPVIASFRYKEAYPTPPPLCEASTAEEVDERLEALFQHPEVAAELGHKSRDWVVRHHNSQMLATRLETLYQSILDKHKVEKTFSEGFYSGKKGAKRH